jgi:Leucine-rich repeat (LRR) protein
LTYARLKEVEYVNTDDGYEPKISDLTGLEYSGGFMELFLDNQAITDLSPLAKIGISNLSLGNNKIKDISPLGVRNRHLWGLNLRKNQITDISPLAKHPMILHLNLSDNLISDLSPLVGNRAISMLELSNN